MQHCIADLRIMKRLLCLLSLFMLCGCMPQFQKESVPATHGNGTYGSEKSNVNESCMDSEIKNLCTQCAYFLENCEDSLIPKCELGEAACGGCRSECLRLYENGEDTHTRRKRQADICIGIKGACGSGGHCCVGLVCQSTSAGRGNRRKTCRP